MGVIHAAVHRDLGIQVAVKIVTDGQETAQARSMFRDEVRAVAGLRHPHIVRVFDYGVLPDEVSIEGLLPGSPYLIMERAECTLAQRPRNETWPHVRGILLPLLDALAHAHARGLGHCDLKLSNVLVGGVRPGLKLADFGIAQALDDGLRDVGIEARSAGTPTYMAPEQFGGRVRDFGPGTDLYALGVMAWMLVTGNGPYRSKDWMKLAYAHSQEPLPPLNANRGFPVELEDWLGWLLEKDERTRCARAADAAMALRSMREPRFTLPPRPVFADEDTVVPPPACQPGITLMWSPIDLPTQSNDTPPPKRQIPPMPPSWKRGRQPIHERALAGVGLGLFGLRRSPMVGRQGTKGFAFIRFTQRDVVRPHRRQTIPAVHAAHRPRWRRKNPPGQLVGPSLPRGGRRSGPPSHPRPNAKRHRRLGRHVPPPFGLRRPVGGRHQDSPKATLANRRSKGRHHRLHPVSA